MNYDYELHRLKRRWLLTFVIEWRKRPRKIWVSFPVRPDIGEIQRLIHFMSHDENGLRTGKI